MLKIKHINASFLQVLTSPDIERELQDAFTFKVPGYRYMPAYRAGIWSGDVKMYNRATKRIYAGLLPAIEQFAKDREYDVIIENPIPEGNPLSLDDVNDFLDTLDIPEKFKRLDYQIEAMQAAINSRRRTMVSPTASGKSFMIYSILRYFAERTLIIVPNTGLIHQMADDFADYGYKGEVHKVYSGQEKDTTLDITISTWQSLVKMPVEWFHQFKVVICDEVHGAKAKQLTSIMEKCEVADVRLGFTGTLDGTVTNKVIIEGLFGAVKQVVETHELMSRGVVADLAIKCIILQYPDDMRKHFAKNSDYPQELDYIVTNSARNKFIRDLSTRLSGNTLVIYNYVDKHGQVLYDAISKEVGDTRPVYFVHGGVKGEDRNQIRKEIEEADNAIIVASYKTFSTGINIKNLQNLIIASPTKARITLLQSIGRILRKHEQKTQAVLYDIGDDLSWKSRKNHTIRHLLERIKIYNSQKFNYQIRKVEFKG